MAKCAKARTNQNMLSITRRPVRNLLFIGLSLFISRLTRITNDVMIVKTAKELNAEKMMAAFHHTDAEPDGIDKNTVASRRDTDIPADARKASRLIKSDTDV